MFKVGDKVRANQTCVINGITVGDEFTVHAVDDLGYVEVTIDGHRKWLREERIELIQDEPCACSCDWDEAPDFGEERYDLMYTREYENGDRETAMSTISGDSADDIVSVLQAMRDFLVRSGFQWVAELNVTSENGDWWSSNTAR